MTLPVAQAHLAGLRPYKAAAATQGMRHNLSANEACLGPSQAAVAAAAAAAATVDRYPDGGASALRAAIGQRYKLDPERIVCGAGSEELISLIVQAWTAPGEEVLFRQYGFIKYGLAARAYGAAPVRAAEVAFTADVNALLGAVTPRTRVLFLANPNNPMGTFVPGSELRRLRAGLREDIVLVVDAAYAEFVVDPTYDDGLALATDTANTIALRTFSKIHGLAGLRCGWGYGTPELIEALHKVRGAFNVSAVAQAAAAVAVADLAHEGRAREHNAKWLTWLTQRLQQAGLEVIPSVCNFLVVRFEDADACRAAVAALTTQGALVMPLQGYGLPEALRITIGTEEANRLVADTLTGVRP